MRFSPLLRQISKLPRSLLAAFCLALAILMSLGVLSYHSIERQARTADWVTHTYLVTSSLQRVFSYVQDAESAQRAFSITGKENYIEPYQRATGALPGEMDRLGTLVSDNSPQRRRLQQLRAAIDNRMKVVAARIEQRRLLGAAALAGNFMNGSGLQAMEAVRARMDEMIGVEARLLSDRQAASERARTRSRVLLVTGSLASLGLLAGVFCGLLLQILRTVRAEQDTQKSNAQLQIANNELRAFSYSVAHDLRAPLRAISGFAQVLIEDCAPQLATEDRNHLDRIVHNARMMAQLIDDLLSLSRIGFQPLKSTRIEMTALARDVFEELRDAQPGREIDFQIANLPPAAGDPSLMRQVWVNLIGNALKFTRRRDKVRIEVGGTGAGPDFVTYFVRDNGAGFDMQYAGKLFGAFQRLHRPSDFEGTGIGLALVQRIIQRHGGTIWAEGEENVGARFAFTMPEWNGG